MKKIIKIEVQTQKKEPLEFSCDLLVGGVFSDVKTQPAFMKKLDPALKAAIDQACDLGDFEGKPYTNVLIYGNESVPFKRFLLMGLGEKKKADETVMRKAAAAAAKKAVELKVESVAMALHTALGAKSARMPIGQVLAEGIYFGTYRYDEYVGGDDENKRPEHIAFTILEPNAKGFKKVAASARTGCIIGEAQSYARTIANRPANIINPPELASTAKKLAGQYKELTCTVYDEKQLKQKKMGGILAVGGGSKTPPRLIILKYTPKAAKAKKLPTIALVGKAVTFDSGGISIKPSANMDQMKLDKSGGIAVLGTMKAISELQVPIEVYGLIPSAENMPGGSSYRPGDIVQTYSGKSVEVLNTDAEGRMILCDALHYATEQKCDMIVDIATLTGACMVALGKYMAGVMSNDDKMLKQLKAASKQSGEKIWHLPCSEEYEKEMKSKIADLRNIGSRWGGACTAAAFLKQFIGETRWAHIDMAGVDLFEKADAFSSEGSGGFGVRLLTTFVMNAAGKK